jgi:hypothetical protein
MKISILASTLAAAILCHGSAIAQVQTKEQQACINGLNSSMAKFSGLTAKIFSSCTTDQAKGNTPSAESCALTDGKLPTFTTKNCEAHDAKCNATPSFGYSSCSYVSVQAPYGIIQFWRTLFGSAAGVTACDADKVGCNCQSKVLKTGLKVLSTYLKTYNACKKSGLASETPITSTAALTNCYGFDPKESVQKALTKLGDAILGSCDEVAVPFSQGQCSGLNGASLHMCVYRVAICNSCLTISASDNLGVDCDLVDDNDTGNDSCLQ